LVTVSVEADQVVFSVEGWDKLWAMRSQLRIPAAHIRGVRRGDDVQMGIFDAIKMMGTSVPGLFRAGSFLQHGDMVFWDVRDRQNAIVVDLEHENYRQLIIEVADPAAAVQTIESAIQGGRR
jgi:hypothetical protein